MYKMTHWDLLLAHGVVQEWLPKRGHELAFKYLQFPSTVRKAFWIKIWNKVCGEHTQLRLKHFIYNINYMKSRHFLKFKALLCFEEGG